MMKIVLDFYVSEVEMKWIVCTVRMKQKYKPFHIRVGHSPKSIMQNRLRAIVQMQDIYLMSFEVYLT